MKKNIMMFLISLGIAVSSFAAVAEIQRKVESSLNDDGTFLHRYDVVYYGNDVPGKLQYGEISINTTTFTVIGTIPGLIATAVRSYGVNVLGVTIPANKVLIPTYSGN